MREPNDIGRGAKKPSRLINLIDDSEYDTYKAGIAGDYSRRATIDRALDSFLSISGDTDFNLYDSNKTLAIHLLGEKTLKAGSFGQPAINYYAQIAIGEPAKTYRIQFDLTTNDIFVPHYELMQQLRRKMGLKTILRNDQSYRCKKSETGRKIDSKRQRGIDFQGTRFEGKMYEDYMQLSVRLPPTDLPINDYGDEYSSICINQHFVAVKKSAKQKTHLSLLPVHGYLGLGPRQRSPTGIKSFLLNLLEDKHIERLQFSLWFNKWAPSATLLLGGVQREKYLNPIEWHHSDSDEWNLEIERIELGQIVISNFRDFLPRVSINLSVHEIYGPREPVKRIHRYLNVNRKSKLPLVDSSDIPNMPPLVIYIDDLAYRIEPKDYVRWCEKGAYVAIFPSKNNRWVLGSIFLETRYSVFDAENFKIGFARLHPSLTGD